MKVTILIDEYLPDTNQIIVRVCKMTSREPILNHKALAIDLDKLDLYDTETFLDSFMRNYGSNRVAKQEDDTEIVLYCNYGKKIEGELNLRDLVGENINYEFRDRLRSILKMRRVELLKDFLKNVKSSQFALK